MKKKSLKFKLLTIIAGVLLGITLTNAATFSPQASNRVNINLDTGWLFVANDNASYSGKAASEASFSKVCVPHANVIIKHLYQSGDAYKIISWYRRHFNPPSSYTGRRFLLEFQGVASVAAVYVNGSQVNANTITDGTQTGLLHLGAYSPFTLDITDNVTVGQDNVIAVQVDSKSHTEIPPEGNSNMDFMIFGGIVRHVNLIVTDPLHVTWTFVSTQNPSQTAPSVPTVSAKVRVTNNAATTKSCTVITNIVDAAGNVVATASSPASIAANASAMISQTTSAIASPNLWSIDHPYLYTVYTQVQDGATFVDEHITRMGIRSVTLSKTDGKCYLNGQVLKLRGLNRHETYAYFGRAASRRLQRKDADILKYDLGCNIVRTSHYLQSPDFFDRCDEIGLLVLEEIPGWNFIGGAAWKAAQMQNLKDMVMRDRNHPSLLTWGCRMNESKDDVWYKSTSDTARALDSTRLTCGVRNGNGIDAAYFYEDIWTQNFVPPNSSPSHTPFITTEFGGHTILPQIHTWDNDSFQVNQITNTPNGHAVAHQASYATSVWAGLLGWCAFDYYSPHPNATTGEVGRGNMGYISPHGVASVFRLPKLAGYFYQSQRDPTLYGPMVHICNFWTSTSPTTVLVVSNCEQVELYQDGTLISKKTAGNLYPSLPHPVFSWNVPFKSGQLKAVGYIGGVQAATHIVTTPGSPKTLAIAADTNVIYEGGDMTRIVVSLLDSTGQILHARADSVTLSASGAADFIGEAKTALEGGQMAFYVKTRASQTGTVTCMANAAGLSGTATISVIKDPGIVSTHEPRASTAAMSAFSKGNIWYRTALTNHFALPLGAPKNAKITVFDMKGRLLFTTGAKNGMVDFAQFSVAEEVHIVKIAD